MAAINSRKWDFVVLQEHSRGPSEKKDLMFEYARKLDAAIYGCSPVGLSATIKGVTDTEAASLQTRAWAAVQERPGK